MSMGWTAQVNYTSEQICICLQCYRLFRVGFGRMDCSCARAGDWWSTVACISYSRTFKLCLVWGCSCSCDAWWTSCLQVPGQFLLGLLACILHFLPTSLPPQRSVNFMSTICYSAASLFLKTVWFARNQADKWGVTTTEHFGVKKLVNEVMLCFKILTIQIMVNGPGLPRFAVWF